MSSDLSRPLYERSLTNQIASLGTTPSILLPPREFFPIGTTPSGTPPLTPGRSSSSPPSPGKLHAVTVEAGSDIYAHLASSPSHLTVLSTLDPTLPISTLLREGTKRAHAFAEHSDGARALIGGTLEQEEYLRYLVVLWVMYKGLEEALDRVATREGEGESGNGVSAVKGIWKRRRLFSRTRGLESDIQTFTTRLISNPTHAPIHLPSAISAHARPTFPLPAYLHPLLISPPQALSAYTTRLAHLAIDEPARLLSHAYVRYLGDLSGGQLVAQRIKRTYHLGASGGGQAHTAASSQSEIGTSPRASNAQPPLFPLGTKFYEFDFAHADDQDEDHPEGSSVVESEGAGTSSGRRELKEDIDEVKGWFRETMDVAVGDDEELKVALVDEAITAFQLSTSLFSLLSAPAPKNAINALTPPSTPPSLSLSGGEGTFDRSSVVTGIPGSAISTQTTQSQAQTETESRRRAILTIGTYAVLVLAVLLTLGTTNSDKVEVTRARWAEGWKGLKTIAERFALAR